MFFPAVTEQTGTVGTMQPLASMDALESSGDARRWAQWASLQLWLSSTANTHSSHWLHSKSIGERLKITTMPRADRSEKLLAWLMFVFCCFVCSCCFVDLGFFFMCLFYVPPLFSCNKPENHGDSQGAAREYEHSVNSLQNLTSLQISRWFGSLNPRTDSRKYLVYKHACILILSTAYLRNMGEIVYGMWRALKWVPTKVIEVASTNWDTVISNPRMSWHCQWQTKLFVLNSESPWNAEQHDFKSPNMLWSLD